jgi:uncharacterized protein YbcI
MDQWDCINLKSSFSAKEIVSRLKRLPTEWEKIFCNYSSDEVLITRIYRELKKTELLKIQQLNEEMGKWIE